MLAGSHSRPMRSATPPPPPDRTKFSVTNASRFLPELREATTLAQLFALRARVDDALRAESAKQTHLIDLSLVHELTVQRSGVDSKIDDALAGSSVDRDFRSLLSHPHASEYFEPARRDVTKSGFGFPANGSYVTAVLGALSQRSPLLRYSTVLTTPTGEDLSLQWGAVLPTPNGKTAEAGSISSTDPTFGQTTMRVFKYPALFVASRELVEDTTMPLEQYCAGPVGERLARSFSADAWAGAGGTSAPQGLMASLTTVTAAGASTATMADVEALLATVPSQYSTPDRLVLLMAPAAYLQLRKQKDSAGNYLWPANAPFELFGYRVDLDPALAAPASGTKSIVAGDFANAYAVRLLPVRVSTGRTQLFTADAVQFMTTLRADGRVMVADACRALVHP